MDRPGVASAGLSPGWGDEDLHASGGTSEKYDLGRKCPSRAGALYRHRRNPGGTRARSAKAHEHSPSVDHCGGNRTHLSDGERGGVPRHPQRIQPHRHEYRAAAVGCFYCGRVSGLGTGRVASLARNHLVCSRPYTFQVLRTSQKPTVEGRQGLYPWTARVLLPLLLSKVESNVREGGSLRGATDTGSGRSMLLDNPSR